MDEVTGVQDDAVSTRTERFDDGVLAIDTLTAGLTRATAGYLLNAPRPALIECGPALSIEHVIAGLREVGLDPDDLAYLVLTHVHLDHAGGAGDLARAFPAATVVVSEVGAPHLRDPDRLNASSRRVYGELMDTVYGDCTAVDGERLLAVGDGHRLDLGGGRTLEMLYTPGHAKHHIGVFDHSTGVVFSGDSVGVKLPGMTAIRPATPPADFHLEAATASLRRYIERDPNRVYLAHYGPVDPPVDALQEGIERLHQWAEVAEQAYREHPELEHVVEVLAARFGHEADPSTVDDDRDAGRRVELLSGLRSNAAGLLRYFQRRDEGTLTPVG
ncbi:MAG TPA: MBL fold metallo-hydrolase [Nitriliruptorales bacterium]|nr:MBL fold metallo-hydrolase [Nitriliruptorales bacterium]